MSRMEPVSGGQAALEAPTEGASWPPWLTSGRLAGRDQEVLDVLLATTSMSEARERLDVSRSYLYTRLRRVAAKLGFQSGPALVQALRAARAVRERDQRHAP
jgi:hypothetical protein